MPSLSHAAFPSTLPKGIQLLFSVVVLAEEHPDDAASDKRRHRQPGVQVLNLGIHERRDQRLAERAAKRVGQQVHALHEALHVGRRLGVRVLEPRDAGEDLADADEHVRGGLDGDVQVVAVRDAVGVLDVGADQAVDVKEIRRE